VLGCRKEVGNSAKKLLCAAAMVAGLQSPDASRGTRAPGAGSEAGGGEVLLWQQRQGGAQDFRREAGAPVRGFFYLENWNIHSLDAKKRK
jgi:hypothetical protein